MLSCILRIAVIATGNYSAVAIEQSQYKIDISRLRGTIYDCNMVPLTNNKIKTVAAVSPTPKGVVAINSCAAEESLENALEILKTNKPTVCEVEKTLDCEGIAFTNVYTQSYEDYAACHLIGYTDSSGHGVSGLQKAYDELLFSENFVSAIFSVNGLGDVLEGIDPYFENDYSIVSNGVVTTIDINIQNVVEKAAESLNSGCIIVSEVKNGKIRALASRPTFDINNLTEALYKENSPMINRALLAYSVGSVFKPCVAACAIENDGGSYIFNCEGSLEIADRKFRCHNISGHGIMNLHNALAQSCNCFFYNTAIELGGDSIYKMAASLNFGSKIKIAENLYTSDGEIPTLTSLNNVGTLANISIGQGNLLLSPVSMLTLYLSIAGDGGYYLPSVVEKTVKDGVEDQYDIGNKTQIMSSDTAGILREYLRSVITEGTGADAKPEFTTAAGKTATAQTGRYYEDGSEITNSWFCGFFPYQNPKYVVVIMSDSRTNISTAEVFAKVTDGICQLEGITVEIND